MESHPYNYLKKNQKWLKIGSLVLALLVMLVYVVSHAKNVVVGDRAVLWFYMIEDVGWWEGFYMQHGPHRLGIMFWLSKCGYFIGRGFYALPGLFVNAVFIWFTAILAMRLKQSLSQKFHYSDLLLPFVICAPWQMGTLLINPFIHVMMPFFAVLFANVFVSKLSKFGLLCGGLFFLGLFSVYAILPAIVFMILLIIKYLRKKSFLQMAMFSTISVASLVFYFHDFKLKSAAPLQGENWLQALKTPILILESSFYLPPIFILFLAVAFGAAIILYFSAGKISLKNSFPIMLMLASLLGFLLLQALGRPATAASATRYYSEVVLMAVIFSLLLVHQKPQSVLSGLFSVFLIWVAVQPFNPKKYDGAYYMQHALTLKNCVLERGSFEECESINALHIEPIVGNKNLLPIWQAIEAKNPDLEK